MAGIEPRTVEESALPARADYFILEFASEGKENRVWCGQVIQYTFKTILQYHIKLRILHSLFFEKIIF